MKLPTFIIFGAVKGGTGALFQYLGHHPQVFTCPLKEPRFFSAAPRSEGAGRRIATLEQYADLFAAAGPEHIALGEASSGYIYSAAAARRIKETIPDVKLIASLRNPVDRAIAQLRMSGQQVPERAEDLRDVQSAAWFTGSLYAQHLEPYYELFSEDQIEVAIVEEWTNDLTGSMQAFFQFLGVDETFRIPDKVNYPAGQVTRLQRSPFIQRAKRLLPRGTKSMINRFRTRKGAVVRESLPADVRSRLAELLNRDIEALERRLGRPLTIWRDS